MAAQAFPVTEYDLIVGYGIVPSVRAKLGKLVFRRVADLIPRYKVAYAMRTNERDFRALSEYEAFHTLSDKEWEQYGEENCPLFEGVTSRTSLRENDPYSGVEIGFANANFAVFDMLKLEFGPCAKTCLMPRKGDLVCGLVEKAQDGRLRFARWFVASEQFFRAWTLCMYWEHGSYKTALAKKCGATAYWMSGNRLVDGYLKYFKSDRSGKPVPFWNKRTEPVTRQFLHILAAIVWVVRYGIVPRDAITPLEAPKSRNANASAEFAKWDLPTEDWVNRFAAFHGQWTSVPQVDHASCVRPLEVLKKETLGKFPIYEPGSCNITDPSVIKGWFTEKGFVANPAASGWCSA